MDSALTRFAAGYDFPLDDFQRRACEYLDDEAGVLVAAPTGSGKTVVGEYATFLALETGRKCFYTTPIKALSNQKFHDLVDRYGADQVGLLTGDLSVNSEAPIVVMTTEVLRNMIYASSRTLEGLGWVVMDEVHYLADRFRGPVWEEVILGLAESVRLVCLSATVSNAEEFGEWLAEVRGDIRIVVSETRPVPLTQHVAVSRRIIDLFAPDQPGDVNPELVRIAREEARFQRDDSRRPRGRNGKGRRSVSYGSGRFGGATSRQDRNGPEHRGPRNSPSRSQVVRSLRQAGLLPAIIFVFSRTGCDAAVSQLMNSDVVLTNGAEADRLREIAERHGAGLSPEERAALGWDRFLAAFCRGIAAHHAGLLPVTKAIVEEGFVTGLLKVVVATETLALGINMPARTVVIERLVKYNGQTHADITPGEYTQLTGRAGRRGIDVQGHAVVCWQPGMDPRAVAGLASRRTYPLRSAFAPTYNMAVNLVASMGRQRAARLLEHSFAQFQTDRRLGGSTASHRRKDEEAIAEYLAAAHCDRGDFTEYAGMRERVSQLEAEQARLRRGARDAEVADSLSALDPGDIIAVPSGPHRGWAVIVDPGTRGGHRDRGSRPHPLAMVEGRSVLRLGDGDIDSPVRRYAGVRIPAHFHPRDAAARKILGRSLDDAVAQLPELPERPARATVDAELADQIADLRSRIRSHPCHSCPDRETHARFAERGMALRRSTDQAVQRDARRSGSIAARFDRICLVLEALGYLTEGGAEVTEQGRMLARIYSELDLVTAEAVREGVLSGLDTPQLAAVLSTLVFESRPADRRRPSWLPDHTCEQAVTRLRSVRARVGRLERDHRLERPRDLDVGFAEEIYAWTAGAGLEVVLGDGMSAGDFVRQARQVADLAGQIAAAGVDQELARGCRRVLNAVQRGVVSMSGEDD
ncbi:RNA helicase [Acidipropionibacterium jensenii]|uniref:RNA helicase n=2 Tax=Acidipropionibacterium jensenii TaxID=1749 RepID=A0A3Q9UIU8_9ACTN|nr:DEAD/DEAH box helicase [Acidipropionibacterium jensenii]AZZ39238.1 RNA helicase [Acidipropionibacterium jensenii]